MFFFFFLTLCLFRLSRSRPLMLTKGVMHADCDVAKFIPLHFLLFCLSGGMVAFLFSESIMNLGLVHANEKSHDKT